MLASLLPRVALPVLSAAFFALATAAAAQDDSVCGDRPGKGFAPCIAPAGHFQIESNVYDEIWDRSADQTTTSVSYANSTLKYGVDASLDVEASITPFQTLRTRERASGQLIRQSGLGDLELEVKYAITKDVAIMPFVSVPTATDGLGAGGFEGGVRAPIQHDLPSGWSIGLTPELDINRDQQGGGAHLGTIQTASLSKQLPAGVQVGVELWTDLDFDPAGETTQASFDVMAAWTPDGRKDLQFDVELDFALTRQTPDVEAILGVNHRF